MTLILGIAGSFIAITGFAVLLETPKKYVPLAGLTGAIGGGIYLYCTQKEMDVVLASFLSALVDSLFVIMQRYNRPRLLKLVSR